MKLILVRHGLARSNLENPASCPYNPIYEEVEERDCSLTPQGERQADLTGIRLKNIKIDNVLCSPFHRTLSTCAGIIRHQSGHLPIEICHNLVEVCATGFTPMPDNLIKTVYDDVIMTEKPATVPEPTDTERHNRADMVASMLYRRFGDTDKNVLVVSHGHFLHQYLIPAVLMLPRAIRDRYRFAAENAAITVIEYKNGVFFSYAIDETAHLGGEMSRDILSGL